MTEPANNQAALYAALAKAQADMPAVEKDGFNPHFKSKFTSLDHLIAKTRPVLNRNGLAINGRLTVATSRSCRSATQTGCLCCAPRSRTATAPPSPRTLRFFR